MNATLTLSIKNPLYMKHLLGAATLSLLALVSLTAAQPVRADGGDDKSTTQCSTTDKSKSDSDKLNCDTDLTGGLGGPVRKDDDGSKYTDKSGDKDKEDKGGKNPGPGCPGGAVPEPGTIAMLGVGALGMAPLVFRARKAGIDSGK